MKIHAIHSFPLTKQDMQRVQQNLQKKVQICPFRGPLHYVAGVDLAYGETKAAAVIVVMDYHSKKVLETVHHIANIDQEYLPGFLAFRELPPFLQAWKKLTLSPDLVFFDGNGLLHPQRMGLATHASFFIDRPTIGVAKSPFIGTFTEPGPEQGNYTYIEDQGEIIGAVLRTQTGVRPVYVSVGNRIDLSSAIDLTMHFVGNVSRIPEITRQADLLTRKLKSQYLLNRK